MSDRVATGRIRPSGGWIVAAVVVLVASVGGCSGLTVASAWNVLDVTPLSREGSVRLEAGDYTVLTALARTQVRVTDPDGAAVDLAIYHDELTTTSDGVEYTAELTFTADEDGTYRVVADGPVAVGEGLEQGTLALGLLLGFVGALLGATVFIIVMVRRSSSRNRLRAAQFAAARPPYPPPPR